VDCEEGTYFPLRRYQQPCGVRGQPANCSNFVVDLSEDTLLFILGLSNTQLTPYLHIRLVFEVVLLLLEIDSRNGELI